MSDRTHRFRHGGAICALLLAAAPGAASAQTPAPVDVTPDIQGDINTNVANIGKQTIGDVLPEPFATWNGLRPFLANKGITFAFTYQSDAMTNTQGGTRTGSTYFGRLQSTVEFDLERMAGWTGATFHASMYQLHGVGQSGHFIGSIAPVSDLEAVSTTRLGEVWLEQKLGDKLWIRAGQLGIDTDFFLSPVYGIGVGATFGWPAIVGVNFPSGGPAYPFVSPGVRVKFAPNDQLTLLAAVFDGDPAGPGTDNPQKRNRYGVNFRLNDPPIVIGEAQYNYAVDYPGTVRVGAWRHFGRFADQRFGVDSLLLSDPNGVGRPRQLRGDQGVYGVIDQQIYQLDGKKDAGVFAFGKISASPSDRNPVDFYFDGGLSFQGMIPGRPDDQIGLLGAYTRVSRAARAADFDINYFNGAFAPVRNYEAILEATYAFKVTNGFVVQPNIQIVIHPGGNVVDPRDPWGVRPVHNALVLGVRTTIQY